MTTNWLIANGIMWVSSAAAAIYTDPIVMWAPVAGTIIYVVGICLTKEN